MGIVVLAVVVVAAVVSLLLLPARGRAYDEIGRSALAEAPPPSDDAHSLEDEVRQLVEARNARRARNGEPPLDVAAEVARELRELRGG